MIYIDHCKNSTKIINPKNVKKEKVIDKRLPTKHIRPKNIKQYCMNWMDTEL